MGVSRAGLLGHGISRGHGTPACAPVVTEQQGDLVTEPCSRHTGSGLGQLLLGQRETCDPAAPGGGCPDGKAAPAAANLQHMVAGPQVCCLNHCIQLCKLGRLQNKGQRQVSVGQGRAGHSKQGTIMQQTHSSRVLGKCTVGDVHLQPHRGHRGNDADVSGGGGSTGG